MPKGTAGPGASSKLRCSKQKKSAPSVETQETRSRTARVRVLCTMEAYASGTVDRSSGEHPRSFTLIELDCHTPPEAAQLDSIELVTHPDSSELWWERLQWLARTDVPTHDFIEQKPSNSRAIVLLAIPSSNYTSI